MTWDIARDLDVGQWFGIAGVWVVALGLSVVVGSWVVPWVLRHASSGHLPWKPWSPPSDPASGVPTVRPRSAEAEGSGEPAPVPGETGGEAPEPPSGTMSPQAMEVLRGGAWLGVLERLAITTALLGGYPHGIAIVVAIKGLGRYAELREHPVASERFVVGTLSSLIWAVGCGLAGLVAVAAIL